MTQDKPAWTCFFFFPTSMVKHLFFPHQLRSECFPQICHLIKFLLLCRDQVTKKKFNFLSRMLSSLIYGMCMFFNIYNLHVCVCHIYITYTYVMYYTYIMYYIINNNINVLYITYTYIYVMHYIYIVCITCICITYTAYSCMLIYNSRSPWFIIRRDVPLLCVKRSNLNFSHFPLLAEILPLDTHSFLNKCLFIREEERETDREREEEEKEREGERDKSQREEGQRER